MKYIGMTNQVVEIGFQAANPYSDPFNQIEMDVCFKNQAGETWKVPAFWAGGSDWRVRFSAHEAGLYEFESVANVPDAGLNGIRGELELKPYQGDNPLYRHGPLRASANGRFFEHADGTPFAWLGDTWWMMMSGRMRYPQDIRMLAEDRVKKGFTIIQTIDGLWCDVEPFDRRGENEAGYCWTENWGSINPEFYNLADQKVEAIADAGLLLCMAGSWGFYMDFMGLEKEKQHYRYMVARYGAYPIVWNLAGEVWMAYYKEIEGVSDRTDDVYANPDDPAEPFRAHLTRKRQWSEMLAYMKELDPWKRMITAHETFFSTSLDSVNNPELLDFHMWQGTHTDCRDDVMLILNTLNERLYAHEPAKPFICAECCYEGITRFNGDGVQRQLFWRNVCGGCAGMTYGAQGIWAASSVDDPFGPSPHGGDWGPQPWQEAYKAPGARQVGAGRKFLNRYPWWKLQPAPDKVENPDFVEAYYRAVAAEIPGEMVLLYLPMPIGYMTQGSGGTFPAFFERACKGLLPGAKYHVTLYNPIDDYTVDRGVIQTDGAGCCPLQLPIFQDWVAVVERVKG